MRIHPLNLLIAVLAAALLAYGLWSLAGEALRASIAIGSFVFLGSALACTVGFDLHDGRVGQSVKLLGWLFFLWGLALNLLFAFTGFSQATYFIACGLSFLLFLFFANAVYGAAQA